MCSKGRPGLPVRCRELEIISLPASRVWGILPGNPECRSTGCWKVMTLLIGRKLLKKMAGATELAKGLDKRKVDIKPLQTDNY